MVVLSYLYWRLLGCQKSGSTERRFLEFEENGWSPRSTPPWIRLPNLGVLGQTVWAWIGGPKIGSHGARPSLWIVAGFLETIPLL